MKNILKAPLVTINQASYLRLLMFFAPMLNFLSGITFDLHTPSLPAIAIYFAAPISDAKNTIAISLFGFSLGCILSGILLDVIGRRAVIIAALILYTIASFSALACHHIQTLLMVRFIQGLAISATSIGCRAIIIDNFTGHQFKVALLYTSLAFGLGPIIAPFIGGYVQYHLGWQANFIAYGLASLLLLVIFVTFVAESKKTVTSFSFVKLFANYLSILKHHSFIPGAIIGGISQIQLLVYTTIGAFLVENILNYSPIVYGHTALIISCGYLLGTFTNRLLIKHVEMTKLIAVGFILLFLAVMLEIIFIYVSKLTLFTLIFPIFIVGFSNGFIFINTLTCCLSYAKSAGMLTALFTCAVMLMSALGTYSMSHIHVNNLNHLAALFGYSAAIELIVFLFFFKKIAHQSVEEQTQVPLVEVTQK